MDKEQAELLINQLASAIADRIHPPVPFAHELWTTKEIAAYIKVAPNKVVERYSYLPGFPKRIELPTGEGRKTHPRWKAIDVVTWVEGYSG